VPPATDDRRRALDDLRREVEECSRCPLGATRTRAVFGEGDPDADLMFVGEAPGYHEDQQGRPFVGAAGKLLDELLASIGLRREQVFIANVLKSRPPNNRDPKPEEIAACEPYLWRQVELIEPLVICTLGNFATKLLSGDPTGITRVHGRPRKAVIGGREVYLFPIFHPAAALYTPSMLATLKEDVARLPELLAATRGDDAVPRAGHGTAPQDGGGAAPQGGDGAAPQGGGERTAAEAGSQTAAGSTSAGTAGPTPGPAAEPTSGAAAEAAEAGPGTDAPPAAPAQPVQLDLF
jgi:uracil-DNA glycosylase